MSLFRHVQILVFNLDKFSFRYVDMSKRKFDRLAPVNGVPNGIIDEDTGEFVYLASGFVEPRFALLRKNRVQGSVDWGYVHTAEFSALFLLTFRDLYPKMSAKFRDVLVENLKLTDFAFCDGIVVAQNIVQENHRILGDVLFPTAPSSTSPSPAPAGDTVVSTEQSE